MTDEDVKELKRRLDRLRSEHRDLDEVISRLSEQGDADQLLMRRMKKRKLVLKDEITAIETALIPDIIA